MANSSIEQTTPAFPVTGLSDDELRRIAKQLGRDPSVVELHAFDAQWSEHCSYKSSRHYLKKLPTTGERVVVGVGEDAGIVHLGEHNGERYGIVVAHESHNHPSQVVPFEGAATGVGGIVRDVLCMGAEVIAIADALRFGNAAKPESHQRYVAQTVVDGISAYGNAIGVPNIAGDVYFHEGFDDNCLVNIIALGIVKENEIIHSAAPKGSAGWDIVLVGKATDPSGFGGASFSSVTLAAEDEDANKGAVQVPDPFLKNVLMRASYRVFAYLRERLDDMKNNGISFEKGVPEVIGDLAGFKDLGAGGVMGCSAEICSAGGYGADINLDNVNVAVPNLPPEVIAVGETQERLLWVLPPGITPGVLRIYNEEFTLPDVAYNACAVVIGTVTDAPRYVLRHAGGVVMDVDIKFLTGSIKDELPFVMPAPSEDLGEPRHNPYKPAPDWRRVEQLLEKELSNPDSCAREPLYRHYDTVVRGATVVARGAGEAGVLAPIPGSKLGVALAVSGNPRYGEIDPRRAGEFAVVEAVRKVIAAGARPIALTDCLNFGNPKNPEQYGQLIAGIDGLADAARELNLPFVSGNVSLYNESSNGSAIPASPIVACIGAIEDVATVAGRRLREQNPHLIFLGSHGSFRRIDYEIERNMQALLIEAFGRGLIVAACVVNGDGILEALTKMIFARGSRIGYEIDLTDCNHEDLLENAGRTGELESDYFLAAAEGWILEIADPYETYREFIELAEQHMILAERDWINLNFVHEGNGLRIPVPEGVEVRPFEPLYEAWLKPFAEIYP